MTHQGDAPGQAVSGLPSVAPGAAPGAEHGVRQCAGATLEREVALAANERPNWRSGQPGLPSADPSAPRGSLARPGRLSPQGERVAAITSIGSNGVPERALLCRPGAGGASDGYAGERGVVRAEPAEWVWAALNSV